MKRCCCWTFVCCLCRIFRLWNLSCVQYAGASWDELKYIRQAVGFLVSTFNLLLKLLINLKKCNYWISSSLPTLVTSFRSSYKIACVSYLFLLFLSLIICNSLKWNVNDWKCVTAGHSSKAKEVAWWDHSWSLSGKYISAVEHVV